MCENDNSQMLEKNHMSRKLAIRLKYQNIKSRH